MPLRLSAADPSFARAFEDLAGRRRDAGEEVGAAVSEILADVRTRGDDALRDYARRFDGWSPAGAAGLRVPADEIAAARGRCDPAALEALKLAAARIRGFHERQRPEDSAYVDDAGVRLGTRWTPVAAAGIYVPGGTAAYPSSVLMNALPAAVAGVARIAMTVPAPEGRIAPLVLAAAELAGVSEVHRVGGAQAVAALAFGTRTIAPVDMIAGPGNAWVAEAKRQVFGAVGVDMIAGPSEILVVADRRNDPAWIAADLMSQAEHDPSAQAILITDDEAFADAVEAAVEACLAELPRAAVARASWDRNGAVVVVGALGDAAPLVDRIAPEHLELAVDDPDRLLGMVRNAGAVFLGRYAPEAVGDYVAGPNHVLPTAGCARFASGLSVGSFMKRTNLVGCDAEALAGIGGAAVALARAEGLDAHALSVSIRLPAAAGEAAGGAVPATRRRSAP